MCQTLDEALDEALDENHDAHEDALDDALEVDLLSRARHLEFAHIWAILLAWSAKIGEFDA